MSTTLTFMSPESRQKKYLLPSQAAVRGGKFIKSTAGGLPDSDVPSDIVNRTPPQDGQIASAGNPYAFKLDGVLDEFGNGWNASPVTNGQAITVQMTLPVPKIRRISAYATTLNWDHTQLLSRAQLDLDNPVYTRTYPAAPYFNANEEIPVGLVPPNPLTFSFNMPQRPVGHHVVLLAIDLPDSGDAVYQVIDFRYTN
nr:lytic polysaccharide monooxygenase [Streptomyces sp. NBC_01001]